ncbi:adenosylmethionine--8-amino-7-oxononanoate transaminase [Sulfurovum sp. TSL1]|uniref:adenosylmethionine--8-amino-7-oxononanoate transaminase n=1 Tax=Sulfurovum sp. TSL1 TaxID=2826994 RepID=UPI001CC7AFD6|nr:adenosylmethionine--8-amino-7-oxononanoate transaminase [Sulfurovum sp. TSL1]GIT99005.1 adenosylmethionine-8-amino-7-oxononanoate aminotransferase [Sulfurovum sp. TSL1]
MVSPELYRLEYDREHILHPYAPSNPPSNMTFVKSAKGVYLELENGQKIIDAMSSWWSVIHGYNVESLNTAAVEQLTKMSHVMFGGITHEPAIKLAQKLIEITDKHLERVFFSDSGSVAVEVALKMAFQYWNSQGNSQKNKILAFSKGYHGDTFGAMSVCDPITGMHSAFEGILHKNIFADSPGCPYGAKWDEKYISDFASKLEQNHKEIAAVIIEPIVQGAGGMNIYSPSFLKSVRALCNKYDVLLILDEIATGFGRTGKLFAYEYANISPDILCVGKALTGGYMSLAATLTSKKVMQGVEANGNVLMHGPTFMANPLACAVANASLELLLNSPWKEKIQNIQTQLNEELTKCEALTIVKAVRTLGAIGVVELHEEVDLDFMTPAFIKEGVWVRPFLNLVYIMPPFVITKEELTHLTSAIFTVVKAYECYKANEKKV